MVTSVSSIKVPTEDLQSRFLVLLPRIETHARIYFRGIACPDKKAERVAETVALVWTWFVRLAERGRDGAEFVGALATYAARAVQSGRRVCGQEPAQDVMSEVAQRKHGFMVEALPSSTSTSYENLYRIHGQRLLDTYEERLQDNTVTPPPDAATFRIDFPAWLSTRTSRDRRIIEKMARDERTQELSQKFGISPGRISQLRREYHHDWQSFNGESSRREEVGAA